MAHLVKIEGTALEPEQGNKRFGDSSLHAPSAQHHKGLYMYTRNTYFIHATYTLYTHNTCTLYMQHIHFIYTTHTLFKIPVISEFILEQTSGGTCLQPQYSGSRGRTG